MAEYKTFKKQRITYFWLAIVAYFLPFIIVSACLLPFVKVNGGFKIAVGLGIVFINAIPFLMGIFKSFFAHFPMLNVLSIVFLCLAAFFTLDVFRNCVEKLLWIESAAAIGSIVSCVFWAKHLKYVKWNESVKATIGSGAFELKGEQKND